MNVPTIEMTKEAAMAKLEACKTYLNKRHDDEFAAAAKGYEALVAGTPLVNLQEIFTRDILDDEGLPRLAIARADRKQVELNVFRNSIQFDTSVDYTRDQLLHTFSGVGHSKPGWGHDKRRYSLVPMVPPEHMPCARSGLKKFHILWEVEQWHETSRLAVPDRDPLLLKHIIGELYAVVASWDLTDLERAIMTGRRN